MVSKKARNLAIKLAASDEFTELIEDMQSDVREQWSVTPDRDVRDNLYIKHQAIGDLHGHIDTVAWENEND